MRKDPEKNKEYQRKWYLKNRELQISRNEINQKKKMDWYLEYKLNKFCVKCGEDHPATLDFHHINPAEKDRALGEMVRSNCSMERILAESVKCQVLCSNCHRIHHWNEKKLELELKSED